MPEVVTMVENEVVESTEVASGKRGRKATIWNIHNNNLVYLGVLDGLKPATAYQYGLTIQAFLQSLGQKTIKRVTVDELDSFVGENEVKRTHLKSLYKWAISDNVGGTADDVQRAVLIWLL